MAFESGRLVPENDSMGSEMSVRGAENRCEGPRVSVSSRGGWIELRSGLNARTNTRTCIHQMAERWVDRPEFPCTRLVGAGTLPYLVFGFAVHTAGTYHRQRDQHQSPDRVVHMIH